MHKVSLINQKGGSSKSTSVHNLAGALAKLGRKVLVVDNDPQSSLSQGLLGPAEAEALDPAETIAAVYRGTATAGRVIRPSGVHFVDLLPGSIHTTDHNVPRPEAAPWPEQTCIREFLADVEGRYDVVLIDNPPNLHLCGWAALAASDYVLIPVVPEDYGSQGLAPVLRSVAKVRSAVNPPLRVLGLILTQVAPRRAIHQLYSRTLRESYPGQVLENVLPDAADFPEAIAHRLPVTSYKPRSAAAKAVVSLAEEILAKAGRSAAEQGQEGEAA